MTATTATPAAEHAASEERLMTQQHGAGARAVVVGGGVAGLPAVASARLAEGWNRFWRWYQRHYLATLVITTGAFLLQLFHLYWLFSEVILTKLTGSSHFVFPRAGMFVYLLADYLEIPALASATVLYVFELRRGVAPRALLYVVLLNTQWIHLFWITDQVVVDAFAGHGRITWNALLAWTAILIDYLEVPVIVDTLGKVLKRRRLIWARVRHDRRGPPPRRRHAAAHGAIV